MKQVWIPKVGKPEILQVKEAPNPEPAKGQVRIDVHFSGINFADILARMGLYPDSPKTPCVVGYEVSGIIDKVGEEVDEQMAGKRVASITRFEGYSSSVCVEVGQVMELSENVSLESAAATPVTYMTAYIMMIEQARIRKEDTILIHGIGGGVGISAWQIAKIYGCKVMGTASGAKHAHLREMGMKNLIDYNSEDFVERAKEMTDGKGVDLVLDPVGGDNFWRSYKALRSLGQLVFYGFSSSAPGKSRQIISGLKAYFSTKKYHPIKLMMHNKAVIGCNLGHLWSAKDRLGRAQNQLKTWLDEGKINPVVDSVFSFEDASKAHRYIQDHKNIGKVLLSPKI
tara:strand:- start:1432 stop:2454 length:1023 start_codon:yes stop_codon:yes gene_type:complete